MIKRNKSKNRKKKSKKTLKSYTFEFRLRVVKLYLEEGYSPDLLNEELGVGKSTVGTWAKRYREFGEDGLKSKVRLSGNSRTSPGIKKVIVDVKKSNPGYGIQRISDILKRFFLIKTSPKTIGKTLTAEGLSSKPKRKPRKNPAKPRFFERARPNQLWQSDIMSFRLAGKAAYLIGYMDDYSRYITSLGLYRSQTAVNVIETYRTGVAEYGVPKEMLTDNGRQYTNWRGTTRFEKELKKDRVKHIRSRPHHPMTLGKIERFWKSILNEFLQKAQFNSYEEARDRLSFWIKYYNYKRPHQGIGGLCPGDRFFEIQHTLKKTLEQGVEENALELALRGKPADPFYMVGRMGDQSVVIRAEKGKVRMLVDDLSASNEKELVYDIKKDIHNEKNKEAPKGIQTTGEGNSSIVGMDRMSDSNTDMPGNVSELDVIGQMAESGNGRDVNSIESGQSRAQGDLKFSPCAANGEETQWNRQQTTKTPEKNPEQQKEKITIIEETFHGQIRNGHETSRTNYESELWPDDGIPGSQRLEGLAKDLLQMGEEGPYSLAGQCHRSSAGPSRDKAAQGARTPGEKIKTGHETERGVASQNGPERHFIRNKTWFRRPGQKKIRPSQKQSRRSEH
nr:IS481 family transposase [Desulfobacula sp.]